MVGIVLQLQLAPCRVTQDELPDGKSFAESRYERVEATPSKSMNEADSGRQFIRIQVEHP